MKHLSATQDYVGGELQNFTIHNLASAPSSPKPGQVYYNTGTKIVMVWNGTAWRPTDAAGLTDGSVPIAALATNPLARANHTGTQLANTISDLATTVQGYRLDQFAAPNTNLSIGGFKLTGVATPTLATDGATKGYVDGAVQDAAAGIDSKPSVRVVAVANVTLSGTQTIDGVALAAGDRVLLTAQSTASQNGVYVVASGAWSRAVDADTTGEVTPGSFWFVEEGTTYGKTQWRCNNTGTITIGTTAITIVQFGAAATYTTDPNGGLQLVGNAFSVLLPSASGLQTGAGGLSIKLGAAATNGLQYDANGLAVKLKTGGGISVDSTGVQLDRTSAVKASVIASGTITANGTDTTYTITHNLGTQDVVPAFRDNSNVGIDVDWDANTTNTVRMFFGTPPANNTVFRWAVTG